MKMPSAIPKFDEIDMKDLYIAMKKAYKNAEDYLYEADILYEMRR